jgi:ferredoxin
MNVRFEPLGLSPEARADETLLDVARRAGAPLGNSCGGIGVCARCRVRVVEGAANLTPPTSVERRVAGERGLAPEERLACQAVVLGDCAVTTGYW